MTSEQKRRAAELLGGLQTLFSFGDKGRMKELFKQYDRATELSITWRVWAEYHLMDYAAHPKSRRIRHRNAKAEERKWVLRAARLRGRLMAKGRNNE